ncbi:hypothetical protein FF1_030932 [Malus domestica]
MSEHPRPHRARKAGQAKAKTVARLDCEEDGVINEDDEELTVPQGLKRNKRVTKIRVAKNRQKELAMVTSSLVSAANEKRGECAYVSAFLGTEEIAYDGEEDDFEFQSLGALSERDDFEDDVQPADDDDATETTQTKNTVSKLSLPITW